MSARLSPSHISLTRCAKLFGRSDHRYVHTLVVNSIVRCETIAGSPKVIFESLPADKQAQYLREEQEAGT